MDSALRALARAVVYAVDLLLASGAAAVELDWVTVGFPGNADGIYEQGARRWTVPVLTRNCLLILL